MIRKLLLALVALSAWAVAQDYNFSDTTPAAPTNGLNVLWQKDASNPINVSAYILKTGITFKLQNNGVDYATFPMGTGVLNLASGCTWSGTLPTIVLTCSGGGGTTVSVNGGSVSNPDFNTTTPAPEAGYQNVKMQVSGSSVSGEVLKPVQRCGARFGYDGGPALVNLQLRSQKSLCEIPVAATVKTVIWKVDAGATTMRVGVRNTGSVTNLSATITPATVGGIADKVACMNAGGTAITIDGVSVTCGSLTATALAAGDSIETTADPTADGTSVRGLVQIDWY